MSLNVKSMFLLTRSILPLLQAASQPEDPGRVINIGSIAGARVVKRGQIMGETTTGCSAK